MSRINTNVSSLVAVRVLNSNNKTLQASLERLATGYRINTAKDDPAGLIASQGIAADQRATEAALANAQRADNLIGTAEGALGEISSLLVNLQGMVGNAANKAGLSQDEKDANQLQVDSILSTINRISNGASFEGVKLLNGGLAYATSGLATTSAFTNVQLNSAQVNGSSLAVTVKVVTAAQAGQLNFLGTGAGLASAVNLAISGTQGSVQISFTAGTKSSAIVAGVNQFSAATGVTAVLSSNAVKLVSNGYGAAQFVSVTSSSTTAFATQTPAGTAASSAYGADASLTVNGAAVTSEGLNVHVVAANLDASLTLTAGMNAAGMTKTFGVTGGGATFSLGALVTAGNLASVGIGNVNTSSLGRTLSSTGNVMTLNQLGSGNAGAINTGDTNLAQSIVTQAVKDVANLRGRLGAFQQNVLGAMTNSLNVTAENLAAAQSAIRDTDFATETANLTRSQILASAATTVLAQANQSPQAVLRLLG